MAMTREQKVEKTRQWRLANPEWSRAYSTKDRRDERARAKGFEDWAHEQRAWRAKNPEAVHRHVTKYRYEKRLGLDVSTIPPKPAHCELCGSDKKISLDHDHRTNRVRGWLCDRCNVAIGCAKDSPALLRKLADYLERKAG